MPMVRAGICRCYAPWNACSESRPSASAILVCVSRSLAKGKRNSGSVSDVCRAYPAAGAWTIAFMEAQIVGGISSISTSSSHGMRSAVAHGSEQCA